MSTQQNYAKCAARHAKNSDADAHLEQGEHIGQRRPATHPELTDSSAETEATKLVTDLLVCLSEAPARAAPIQARIWQMQQ